MSYVKNPSSIEEKSFQIIQSEIAKEHPDYQFETAMQEAIIKRAIHTTGDFDYLYNMRFTHGVNEVIEEIFKNKGTIIVDSTISLNGINKRVLDQMGVNYTCLLTDLRVSQLAKEKEITRSMAAVELAKSIKGPKLFAFGGAPTALSHLLTLVEQKELVADALIGVPVGFIQVEESKEALLASQIPAIITVGRKGGSTIVVATINAILYQLKAVATEDYIRYSSDYIRKEGEK
ncbi:cobalt-precorrin-8 methylmutase [Streptococcus catagoni]|uniref:cobalt-precorrin-8 methylmutase n=1 Tax=Streptococcus catagoni TaxID=2654874 RepID=UPI001407D18D|nr:cobalt-precorrin-8 methylmutase [Streptococcus catagoni]